jgi:hypothetical protein
MASSHFPLPPLAGDETDATTASSHLDAALRAVRAKGQGTEGADSPEGGYIRLAPEVADLLAAVVAEMAREFPTLNRRGGTAPVLGTGVLQEILRRRRNGQPAPSAGGDGHRIDERR